MDRKAVISGTQLLLLLTITRISFSTDYISAINPGNCIQDIIFALPIVFLCNIILALPVLLLLNRHPGHDILDCSTEVFGKAGGVVVGTVLFVVFFIVAVYNLGPLYIWFNSTVVENVTELTIFIPLIAVCVYGAIKGIESIARFGTIVFAVYVIFMFIIYIPLIQKVHLSNFTPLFFDGFGYFGKALVAGLNHSLQILPFAILMPYVKKGTNIIKTFVLWDALSIFIIMILEFFIIGVLGSFGSDQIFPISTLSQICQIGILKRLDSVNLIAWVFDAVLSTTVYLFVASQCLMRTKLKKIRRSTIILLGVLILAAAPFATDCFLNHYNIIFSPAQTAITLCVVAVIPLIVLIGDIVKKKIADAG